MVDFVSKAIQTKLWFYFPVSCVLQALTAGYSQSTPHNSATNPSPDSFIISVEKLDFILYLLTNLLSVDKL